MLFRPDMTFTVDWALNIKYYYYLCLEQFGAGENEVESTGKAGITIK